MPQSRTSSIRYASRIGIGALTLALGSAALTAPAASATSGDTATVTAQPSASASTDASTATSFHQRYNPLPLSPLSLCRIQAIATMTPRGCITGISLNGVAII